jgi:DNA mismatch endonuclease (patch repair protein)
MAKKTSKKKQFSRKAGHRSWAAGNAPVPGGHRGDIMSPEKRSAVMSHIKGKNTSPERRIFARLEQHGVDFARHVKDLPGRPDIVLCQAKVAVFLDGDFWHGWRFPLWEHKLSEKWRTKISETRERDQRNFRLLRQRGWRILRIWEHQIERSPEGCVARILRVLGNRLTNPGLGNESQWQRTGVKLRKAKWYGARQFIRRVEGERG